jgi:hypothetical protein
MLTTRKGFKSYYFDEKSVSKLRNQTKTILMYCTLQLLGFVKVACLVDGCSAYYVSVVLAANLLSSCPARDVLVSMASSDMDHEVVSAALEYFLDFQR